MTTFEQCPVHRWRWRTRIAESLTKIRTSPSRGCSLSACGALTGGSICADLPSAVRPNRLPDFDFLSDRCEV